MIEIDIFFIILGLAIAATGSHPFIRAFSASCAIGVLAVLASESANITYHHEARLLSLIIIFVGNLLILGSVFVQFNRTDGGSSEL